MTRNSGLAYLRTACDSIAMKIRSVYFSLVVGLAGLVLIPGAKAEGYKGKKENLHVYLLIGQSNMAGRAPFTKDEAMPLERGFLLNGSDEWEPAKNPLNAYSTIRKGLNMQKMNPGYTFAKTMLEKSPTVSLGLVVNAKGGSNIGQWKKDAAFYKEAVRRVKIAGKTGTIKGVLWHQGESDAKKPEGYLEKLSDLVKNLREDLAMPDLPFVAGQVNDVKAINDQIAQLPEKVNASSYISSEGLTAMDRWHFDAKSVRIMGERYAEKMLKLQQ